MELIENNTQIVPTEEVVTAVSKSNFIEANTQKVTLEYLKKECIIPVYAKDNESTLSHYQFINKASEVIQELFPDMKVNEPNIRVSHTIKGRIPSAIGKPAKELKDFEKTIYFERCAFLIELPEITEVVNGNTLTLSVGGVRAYNQENLYSKKSLEKFKVFIGFNNSVCTNLCISTDGFSNEIRIASIPELEGKMIELFSSYNKEKHLGTMEMMSMFQFTERQFAHFIGKARMYQYLDKESQKSIFPISLNDSQINTIVKNYYNDSNFGRNSDGSINLWKLYNLFTEANKSSYIDSNFERSVSAYELINNLGKSTQNKIPNWLLTN